MNKKKEQKIINISYCSLCLNNNAKLFFQICLE